MEEKSKRLRSREYPAISLPKAVEFARRIYEKDRWTEAPALAAVQHCGYQGLNGGSRPVLSALKKYGLLDYVGGGENLKVKLTDLAKRVLIPKDELEAAEAVSEALTLPDINRELYEKYPGWSLPSDVTLSSVLERDMRMQNAAIKAFISDLKESIAYVQGHKPSIASPAPGEGEAAPPPPPQESGSGAGGGEATERSERGLTQYPMPNSRVYVMLPTQMSPQEATNILRWFDKVVKPTLEFVRDMGEGDEPK